MTLLDPGRGDMANNAAMPTGVTIAGLGSRALVTILDLLPLGLLGLLVSLLSGRVGSTVMLVVAIATTLLSLGWAVFLWWGYATRGQSPAARWLRVRVLRLADGHPLGWGAYFLRELVWYATLVLPVVWVVLVVMMIVQPRRRGWHDLAGKSVVVRAARPVAPAADARPIQRTTVASPNMVGLPTHLSRSSFTAESPVPEDATDPGPAPIAARPDFASEDDVTRTHLAPAGKPLAAPRTATEGWQLRLDDGRLVAVDGLVLVGRNPRAQASEQAQLVQAGVESRMVSKTHLAVGLDHRGLYVMDRGSTNGTAIANAGGQFEPCAPGDPVRVREGQIVSFGDRYLEVRRQSQ
jgi:uncharacterized RDD family membrane protein YckC